MNIFTCAECFIKYEPVKSQQKFCSSKCRYDFHNKIKRLKLRFANEHLLYERMKDK